MSTKQTDFLGMVGNLDKSLLKLKDDLAHGTLEARYAKAAQTHFQHSRKWIKHAVLDNPACDGMIVDQNTFKSLKNAVEIVQKHKPATKQDLVIACDAVDTALGRTYTVIRELGGRKGFTIDKPISPPRTLSILPGDPDFPTDTEGEVSPLGASLARNVDSET
jgi:hypothetical protein